MNEFEVLPKSAMPRRYGRSHINCALTELVNNGADKVVRIAVPGERSACVQKAVHTYAERMGIIVTTRRKDGYVWIEYLGPRPSRPVLSDSQRRSANEILRNLGR